MSSLFRKIMMTASLAMAAFAASVHADSNDSRYHEDKYNDDYDGRGFNGNGEAKRDASVQLGPRPFYLVKGMDEGKLKDRLMMCEKGPFYKTDFSIGHRGAAMQFPEHPKESYEAAARMGAGIVECDVTFTKDGELVCRHSECDLHTTTNIVATPLNNSCSVPYTVGGPAPKCCTSDITLSQFKTLKGKMDASNPAATSAQGYLGRTASWRTDLYTGRATLMTLKESIALNKANGVKHTPELKSGDPVRIQAVFSGQGNYSQRMIDTLVAARIDPKDVWLQSFDGRDILYWVQNAPQFRTQAVYLDSIDLSRNPLVAGFSMDKLRELKRHGVKIITPPMPALLSVNANNEIVPSQYAIDIKSLGFDIITRTFERSDLRQGALKGASKGAFYYNLDAEGRAIKKNGDMYKALDVLARQVEIIGIFSDWPATVSYYANCMGLK